MYIYFYIKGETHMDIVLISLLFIFVELRSVVLGQNSDYPKVKTYYKKRIILTVIHPGSAKLNLCSPHPIIPT